MSDDDIIDTKLPSYEMHHAGAEAAMRRVANAIKENMPPGFGFTLFIFEYGEGGSNFYVSSADRADMLKVLKEFIAKQESAS